MSPNLERYGITITHSQGASQTGPIDYLATRYNLVEVIRPQIGKFAKPSLTVYMRITYEEARDIPNQIEVAGEVYSLAHFYTFKCATCNGWGHNAKRHINLTLKREQWVNKMSRAFDAVDLESKRSWIDTLPEELREIKLTRL